jgi:hypothetical protein
MKPWQILYRKQAFSVPASPDEFADLLERSDYDLTWVNDSWAVVSPPPGVPRWLRIDVEFGPRGDATRVKVEYRLHLALVAWVTLPFVLWAAVWWWSLGGPHEIWLRLCLSLFGVLQCGVFAILVGRAARAVRPDLERALGLRA